MSAESKSTWLFRLTSPLAAGVVLAIFYAVLLTSLHDKSATFDEPGHAIAGYIYWKHGNYRIDPENGNLPQRLIALPLLFGDFKFPSTESNAWRNSDSWPLADAWFNRLGNDTAAMLARGRAGAGLIAVALGAMIWLWSRRFFGPAGGMLSLLLYALNPAVLANGALITSDIASALAFLAASWSFWAMLEKFSPTRVLLSALVVSALFITKVSAVLFIPMAVAMVVARLIDGRPLPVGGLRALSGRKWQFLAIVAGAVVHAVVIFAVIWAAYGFRFAASAPGPNSPTRFVFPWEWALDQPNHIELINRLNLPASQQQQAREIFESSGVLVNQWSFESIEALRAIRNRVLTPAQAAQLDELMSAPPPRAAARLALFARTHHLLPEAYLFGYAHVWKLSNERSAFLNGEFRTTGWWWFFPYAFAVKTPLVFFGFLALAFLGAAARWRSLAATIPLWTLLVVYWGAIVTNHVNIGHRHLLPIYPPLFILCGAAVWWLERDVLSNSRSRVAAIALGGLLAAIALEMVSWFPNYLAYFNGLVSPSQGYRHLIDSSLDWGQDLPAARRYVDRLSPTTPTYLAYFGMASPVNYGIKATQIYGHFGYEVVSQPAFKVLSGVSPQKDREKVLEILRSDPAYDPSLVSDVDLGTETGTLFVKHAAFLRLTGGTYLISASLIQPVFYFHAFGPWNAERETTWQQLAATMRPILSDDRTQRVAAIGKLTAAQWQQTYLRFLEFRFARLAAYLRHREPDDNINYSILVYHLTEADIARALDGPPP